MNTLCVVGAGSIGRRHIENFSELFDRIDIVEPNAERAAEVLKSHPVNSAFASFEEAIADTSYQAVAICAPPHVHLPIAELAARSGSHLFIEKPLGMNVSGWNDLALYCEEKGIVSYVAYCHRHIPYTEVLKSIVQSGAIGRVIHGNMRWGSYLPDWHPWEDYRTFYMAKREEGGGALMDESHGIDIARYILGEVTEVFAIVDTISDLEISSDDTAFLTLRFENRSVLQINFDLSSRCPRVSLEIIGTEGTVIWDRIAHEVRVFSASTKEWEERKYSKDDLMAMYPNQARHFYNCIVNGDKSIIDIRDAIKTQAVIDAGFESSASGKLISVRSQG